MNEKYVVVEIQTNHDGTIGNLVTAYDDRNSAESAFHSILASAAISSLPLHAAVLLTSAGSLLDTRCYDHQSVDEEE